MDVKCEKGLRLVQKLVRIVFPEVNINLDHYISLSMNAGDETLSREALSSIKLKKFHAQGGSAYALYPNAKLSDAVSFISALQTISDYLDNLCDRIGIQDEASFRQLHLSMLDAVDPGSCLNDYYLYFPYKNDSGYLKHLVEECRHQVSKLPSYSMVISAIKKYVLLYSQLQTYKHLACDVREKRLAAWASLYAGMYPDISCWEFSAATGSTLGIFVLYAAAADPLLTFEEVEGIDKAYFPWVCGLHILLDYYIDSQEDMQTGDLNFTTYYDNLKQCEERLSFFIDRSLEYCSSLRYPGFHITIIKGLLAMYLSDPKALLGANKPASRNLIKHGGNDTVLYYTLCRLLRVVNLL